MPEKDDFVVESDKDNQNMPSCGYAAYLVFVIPVPKRVARPLSW